MTGLLSAVLRLISEALAGRKTEEQVAKELLAAAFETGVPASILLEHLTQLGIERGELAADLAQWAKTGGR